MGISVIVPIYKGQKYIEPIQKMVSQNVDYADSHGKTLQVELLFVNDYPDEIIKVDVAKKQYEVEVIVNDRNRGIHQTRVNGLKKAKGEYILFLDQDDEITQNCLYSQYNAIEDNDIVVGNGYRWINGQYRKIYRNIKKQRLACKESIFLKATNQIVSPGHCLIKKTAIVSTWIDNIMEDNGADDLFLWLLMFENNKKFSINQDCVYKHVYTGINLSSDLDIMNRSSNNIIRLARESGCIDEKKIKVYERRVAFLNHIKTTTGLKRCIAILCNLDIVILKIYAFYR